MKKFFIYALAIFAASSIGMACGTGNDKGDPTPPPPVEDDNGGNNNDEPSTPPNEDENGTPMIMATYNIRVQTESNTDKVNGWAQRSPHLVDIIKKHGFELFGTQEGLKYQLDYIQSNLPGFKYVGVGRDDGSTLGEYAAIFYDTTKFDLLDSGNFWLSETPDEVSKGWDAAYRRVCTWGKFRHKESKFTFVYFNLHMDHVGVVARRESAKLILDKIKKFPEPLPVILSGDFNIDQSNESYELLNTSGVMRDSYVMAKKRKIASSTYNAFDPDHVSYTSDGELSRIDHIFLSKEFKVNEYEVVMEYYFVNGADGSSSVRVPSDHYPVMLHVVF